MGYSIRDRFLRHHCTFRNDGLLADRKRETQLRARARVCTSRNYAGINQKNAPCGSRSRSRAGHTPRWLRLFPAIFGHVRANDRRAPRTPFTRIRSVLVVQSSRLFIPFTPGWARSHPLPRLLDADCPEVIRAIGIKRAKVSVSEYIGSEYTGNISASQIFVQREVCRGSWPGLRQHWRIESTSIQVWFGSAGIRALLKFATSCSSGAVAFYLPMRPSLFRECVRACVFVINRIDAVIPWEILQSVTSGDGNRTSGRGADWRNPGIAEIVFGRRVSWSRFPQISWR